MMAFTWASQVGAVHRPRLTDSMLRRPPTDARPLPSLSTCLPSRLGVHRPPQVDRPAGRSHAGRRRSPYPLPPECFRWFSANPSDGLDSKSAADLAASLPMHSNSFIGSSAASIGVSDATKDVSIRVSSFPRRHRGRDQSGITSEKWRWLSCRRWSSSCRCPRAG
jgi:hypothetical protein